MSQQRSDSKGDVSPSSPRDADYPPQLHAGAVGLGPEFGKGATIGEKIDGMKEEIKGKVKHDPELVQHGRDQRTGELKRKEMRKDLGGFGQPDETEKHPDEGKREEEDAGQERPDAKMIERPEDK